MKKTFLLIFTIMLFVSFTELAYTQNLPVKISSIGSNNKSNINNSNNGSNTDAQNITVLPSNGSTSGNGRAPQGSRRFINSKYLITGSEMTTSGFGANAITSIGWTWNTASGVAQSVPTTGRLVVYVRDTSSSALTIGSTFIDTNGVGYTKIIEGTINIPAQSTAFTVDVPVGGPGTSAFTPTLGNGVLVIFVYTTLDPTLATGNPTVMCSTTLTGNVMMTYQSQTVNGTAGATTTFRPETRFGNALTDVVEVTQTYTLGKVANPFGIPFNISTLVKNNSASPITFDVGISIKDSATGTVRYTNTATVTGLATNTSQEVFFNDFNPTLNENDSIIVTVATQPGETFIANNRSAKITRINSNTYGYGQKFTADGGVGFNAPNTGDFVARFHTNSSNSINQIDVNFAAGGQPFQVGIWDATGTGGTPGTNVYTSASQTSTAGVFTVLISPPVAVNGDFFVGVKQTAAANVNFAYQTESPIRDSTFYYTIPTGGTTWTDFAPANAFRFMIEPKFALNRDVGATTINQNGTTYFPSGTTNIPMTGTAANFGLLPATFDVNRKILDGSNNVVYNNSVTITGLASSTSAVTTFPDFTGFVTGTTYTIKDSTLLSSDQNHNNDKFTVTFTPFVAKTMCLLYTDAPSRDSLSNQLNNAGYTGTFDMIDGATFTGSFRAWRSIFYVLASSGNWTAVVRDSLKAFLDNSSPSSKKSLAIFGNDLGYNNDPIRNVAATAADTTFYRQYLRAQYVADSWISAVPTAAGKIYGASGSPFSAITGDSVADAFPDMVKAATWYGGAGSFLPLTVTTGDSAAGVYYVGTNYNMFYGTNVYANYRSKSDGTFDNPATILNVIKGFIESNGGLVPVELTSFTSNVNGRNLQLKWATVTEQNNSGYDIEKKISGTENWSKIGNVSGNGTSTVSHNYSFSENNVATGKYNYRLKQIDFNGNYKYYDLSNEVIVGVPQKFDIAQNYPNPFNPSTKINYDLPFDSKVAIKIFDMTGREVASIVNQIQTAGYYTVNFNASSLSSGVYFYQINADGGNQNFVKTMKMVLVK